MGQPLIMRTIKPGGGGAGGAGRMPLPAVVPGAGHEVLNLRGLPPNDF